MFGDSLPNLPLFDDLTSEQRKTLAPQARIQEYPKKRILFKNGEDAKNLYVVLGGYIKLSMAEAGGGEAVIRVAAHGDILALTHLLCGPAHMLAAEVLVPATVLEIPFSAVRPLLSANPAFSARVMKAIGAEMQSYLDIRQMLSLPAVRRVGWLLLRLSRQGGGDGSFRFLYDKGVAAAELCMSPETFSRALSQLKGVGMTHDDDEIILENAARLKDFVTSGERKRRSRRMKK
jgi:CRP/FNR family transcriptional regulator, dissimilatory nitrate respiration regulator